MSSAYKTKSHPPSALPESPVPRVASLLRNPSVYVHDAIDSKKKPWCRRGRRRLAPANLDSAQSLLPDGTVAKLPQLPFPEALRCARRLPCKQSFHCASRERWAHLSLTRYVRLASQPKLSSSSMARAEPTFLAPNEPSRAEPKTSEPKSGSHRAQPVRAGSCPALPQLRRHICSCTHTQAVV
jgi:hypothetical protein